jgi:hypothetical protein
LIVVSLVQTEIRVKIEPDFETESQRIGLRAARKREEGKKKGISEAKAAAMVKGGSAAGGAG